MGSTLLATTGNLTSSLTLGNILPLTGGRGSGGGIQSNQMGSSMNKQTDKSSAATANNKQENGILGIGIL